MFAHPSQSSQPSGCLPVCYEAVGGRDFLHDGHDSFVLPNHHAYALVERLLDLLPVAEREPERLLPMRLAARASAGRFDELAARQALVAVFRELVGNPAAAAR